MSERPPLTPPAPANRPASLTSTEETPAEGVRASWSREDDELLLLDEIEETPDDERIEDLV
jgi:hypothetical protein